MLRSDGVNFEDERVNYRDDGGEFFVKKRDARCAGFDFLRGEYYRSRFLAIGIAKGSPCCMYGWAV